MAGGYVPPPLGPYQYHEVLSALRKCIKLNQPREAIYWANVMLEYLGKPGPATLAKQLWIMSAEDIDDPPVIWRCFVVLQMAGKVPETDQMFYLIAQMCRARKWWEHQEGRDVDLWWAQAIGDLKDPARQHQIPSFALDRHTRRGWANHKSGVGFDDRFSGTELGRQKTSYMFQRDGFLHKDSQVFVTRDGEPDDGFYAFWHQRRQEMAMTPKDLEPNDPIGPMGLAESFDRLPLGLQEEPDIREESVGVSDGDSEHGR